MATITYELGNPKADKTRKIAIVLSHKGQRRRIPINLSVAEEDITRSGKIKASNIRRTLNNRLSALRGKLYDLEENITNGNLDIDGLYSQLTGNQEKLDFFEYAEHWIEKSKNKGKETIKQCLTLSRSIIKMTLSLSVK